MIEASLHQLTHRDVSLVPAVATARDAAEALRLVPEERWLTRELRGYVDPGASGPSMLGEILGVGEEGSTLAERIARCRALEGEVLLQFNFGHQVEPLPYPYFATQSVAEIEGILRQGPGALRLTVQWDHLPDIYRTMFKRFGLTARDMGPGLPVMLKPQAFVNMHQAIKAEVAGFLSTARLLCETRPAQSGDSFVVGNIQAQSVQIVQAGKGATVSINGDSGSKEATDLIAALKEEIEAVQDLIIGNRKQMLAFADDQEVVKADLRAIVARMATLLGTEGVDLETVRSTAEQVIGEMRLASQLHDGALKRFIGHGITQSALGSTLFEALRHVFT